MTEDELKKDYVNEYREEEEESLVIDIPKKKVEYLYLINLVNDMLKDILRRRMYKKYKKVIVIVRYE